MALTTIKNTTNIASATTVAVLNDISTQFDGSKTVFQLTKDSAVINTIVDSKDVDLVINGQISAPYVAEITYPWISTYASYKGFRIKEGNIIIFNAPNYGDQCVMIIRNSSLTAQTRRYPYTATSIALGD